MRDDRDNRIFTDSKGNRYLKDSNGNILMDEFGNKILPTESVIISKKGEFLIYDNSQGHCSFCGKINCNGRCFK